MAENKMWHLVCYDIRDPKRWRRCFKLLKGYGVSLQYSIFRCYLSRRQLERMRWELEKELAPEDSLMIAALCSGCVSRVVARNTHVEWIEQISQRLSGNKAFMREDLMSYAGQG